MTTTKIKRVTFSNKKKGFTIDGVDYREQRRIYHYDDNNFVVQVASMQDVLYVPMNSGKATGAYKTKKAAINNCYKNV